MTSNYVGFLKKKQKNKARLHLKKKVPGQTTTESLMLQVITKRGCIDPEERASEKSELFSNTDVEVQLTSNGGQTI